ncbi:MAG: o-succinylbenzoate synthase [Longimicrobiales bacterium]|nr:o-succinylbenzoate synthase [Longimicrobiales bacterium]
MTTTARIDRIELRVIPLTLRERFEISSGAREARSILIVTVHGEGEMGWGECVASEDPGYSYETTETAWHVLRDFLAPAVVGRGFHHPSEVLAPMAWVRGHPMAKAAIEMATWELWSRLEERPLAETLGGELRSVPVGVSVGLQRDDAALAERIERHLEEGYARIKLKIKPGRDVAMVETVRERFPEIALMVDANSAYTLDDLEHLRAFDAFDLMMVEQPLAHDDIRDHAILQKRLKTPICLDEAIRHAADAMHALEVVACGVINVKPGRVGGFTNALAIHDICRARKVPVWVGGMLESGIGRAHNVALATLPGFTLPGDISESRRYWHEDLVEPEWEFSEPGRITPLASPGIGVRPKVDRIRAEAARTEVIEAS